MQKTKRTRTQWHDLVRAWRKSRLTAPQFAARQDIDPRQLRWWAWNLGKEAREAPGAVTFVELPRAPEPDAPAMLELTWPDGRVLRFPAHTDRSTLRTVLAAIEGRR